MAMAPMNPNSPITGRPPQRLVIRLAGNIATLKPTQNTGISVLTSLVNCLKRGALLKKKCSWKPNAKMTVASAKTMTGMARSMVFGGSGLTGASFASVRSTLASARLVSTSATLAMTKGSRGSCLASVMAR